MTYAILGRLTAKTKIDGRRVKVRKKAHLIRDGRALCRAENAYKKLPRYTAVENPEPGQVCKICLALDGRDIPERPRHPVRRESGADNATILPDDNSGNGVSTIGRAARAEAPERFEPGAEDWREPSLAVLLGEAMADEPDTPAETSF